LRLPYVLETRGSIIEGMTHSFPVSFPRAALLGLGAVALVVVVFKLRWRKRGAAAREQPRQDEVVADERGEEEIQLVRQSRDDTPKHGPSPCVYGEAACRPTRAVSEEEQKQQLNQKPEQDQSFAEAAGSMQHLRPSPCVYGEAASCPAGAGSEEGQQQQLKQELEQHRSFDAAPGSSTLTEPEEVQQPPQTAERFFTVPTPCVYEEAACCPPGAEQQQQQQLKQELERHDSFDVASVSGTEPEEVQQPPTTDSFFIGSDNFGSDNEAQRQAQLFHWF